MFAKIKDNTVMKFPYGFPDLQAENPDSNFGIIQDFIATYSNTEDGINSGCELVPVELESIPTYDPSTDKPVLQQIPVLENDRWVLKHSIVELTVEEKTEVNENKSDEVRKIRNHLLSECDWVVIKSIEKQESIPDLWESYRQELRDITTQEDFPWEINWPIAPE